MTTTILGVPEFKRWSRIQIDLDDVIVLEAIQTAEQSLFNAIGRRIHTADAVASDRVFVPASATELLIDDCVEVTLVVNDGATISPSDYQLEPLNGLSDGGEQRPFDIIRLHDGTWHRDSRRATVTVRARWGWPVIPPGMKEAAKVATKAVLDGRDIRLGIADLSPGGAVSEREARVVRTFVRDYRGHKSFGIA